MSLATIDADAAAPISPDTSARYDRTTIALHWIVAGAVVLQWFGAHTIDWFPKGPLRVDARSVHIVVGALLAAALVYRVFWRLSSGVRLAAPDTLVVAATAKIVHGLLYALALSVVSLGVYNTWMRGDDLFGLAHIPKFGSYDTATRHMLANVIVKWHRIAANAILIVAVAHAFAGLFHHYVLRDRVLKRMLPFVRRC